MLTPNIPLASSPESRQTLDARGMPASPEDLQAIVAKMRELGVTEYAGIKLGPAPAQQDDEDEPSEPTADERVKRQRAERQRVASLASGGPVPGIARSK